MHVWCIYMRWHKKFKIQKKKIQVKRNNLRLCATDLRPIISTLTYVDTQLCTYVCKILATLCHISADFFSSCNGFAPGVGDSRTLPTNATRQPRHQQYPLLSRQFSSEWSIMHMLVEIRGSLCSSMPSSYINRSADTRSAHNTISHYIRCVMSLTMGDSLIMLPLPARTLLALGAAAQWAWED